MIMLALLQVVEVMLMAIGFLLKAYVPIGFDAVAILQQQDEPLHAVPKKERQVEQFALLRCVDKFMVELSLVERTDREDEAEQADGQEALSKKDTLHQMDSMRLHLQKTCPLFRGPFF